MIFKREKIRKHDGIKFFLRLNINFMIYIAAFFIGRIFDYFDLFILLCLIIALCFMQWFYLHLNRIIYRIIDKLDFNDEEKKLIIYYTHFFRSDEVRIDYNELSYSYRLKFRDIFDTPKTLELFKNKSFIAEIRNNDIYGWSETKINSIVEKLKIINDERNNRI